ncbi:putative chorismate synthase [Linderina pennispora]|uniref:chorismate synthase n=1 Tax=Linderina pennispora TaxID=61395 RepID=A0A1Y1W2E4_9FUNG|nr:putative chorismate synthase [Linderina pennispora]ORX67314.1 putative chorismate synthase [Linderina pennispora]
MSTFGKAFRSHCKSVGCIIDGVPPGMALAEDDIQPQLTRRRPGQSKLTTPRNEKDRVTIQSGCEFGYTLGTPIALTVQNQDQRPPEKYLKEAYGVEIVAFVSSVGAVEMSLMKEEQSKASGSQKMRELMATITRDDVDKNAVRCPDEDASREMQDVIVACTEEKDSTGGTVTCVIRNCPSGLGEPCFDKLEATLAHAMLSIPATKGFEVGSGFRGTQLYGHEHNDAFESDGKGGLRTKTNHSGGIQGGISNGEHIYFRVAFKPPATISQDQETSTYDGSEGVLAARGRHDPCVVPRAVPIVEAMATLVIMDAVLQQNGRTATRQLLAPVPDSLKGIKPV